MLNTLIGLKVLLANKYHGQRLYFEAQAHLEAKEYKTAFPLMKEASDLGYEFAPAHVAMMLLKGQGVTVNWPDAVKYLGIALERNNKDVHMILGMAYGIGGYGLRRDLTKAEYHLMQSQEKDNDPAAEELLDMLRKRKGPFGAKEIPRPKIPW